MYGSKIDNLRTLREHGIAVPEFKIVKFDDAIDDRVAFAEFFATQIKQAPAEASAELKKYLRAHLKKDFAISLESEHYAVRSSSNLEDGASDSFAGQFKTFLQVSPDDLSLKIRDCFLSLVSENVLTYIKQKKLSPEQVEMNVLVQKMVASELSGVIFTANPQGLLNETVITVGAGLGEGVVGEKVATTSYFYNRTDDIYYFDGINEYLDDYLVRRIIDEVAKIEVVLGKYLDVEFALVGKSLWILQARPITTLKTDAPLVLDNSNIVESYPGISLPLTISFAEMVYSNVFESECRRVLRDENELKKQSHIFMQMVGSCNGRMYYKISNWYALIDYLPFHNKITPMWEEMLGIKNSAKRKSQANFRLRTRVAKNYLNELRKISKNMDWLNKYFIQVEREFRRDFTDELDLKQSIKIFHRVADQLIPHWDYTLINDMYAFINVGILKKQLGNQANELISNISNLESMKPVQEMVRLAYAKGNLSEEEYARRFEKYIEKYGDRNVEELKLESKTFRTNPEILQARIDDYCAHPKKLEQLYNSMMHVESKDLGKYGRLVRAQLRRCENGIRNREISRLNRSRIFGMVRDIFRHIGKLLAQEKALARADDIYYLCIDEVEKYIRKPFDLKSIVAKRKAQYKILAQLPGYSKLIFVEREFDKLPTTINSHEQKLSRDFLRGTPCSNGKVTAKVLVVESAQDLQDAQGKILVTRSTDPGWVFALSTAKGVISERGSLLSHTAIISRELGVPAVVGVKDVTKILKTGDLVTINGSTGEIKVEKSA